MVWLGLGAFIVWTGLGALIVWVGLGVLMVCSGLGVAITAAAVPSFGVAKRKVTDKNRINNACNILYDLRFIFVFSLKKLQILHYGIRPYSTFYANHNNFFD